MSKHTPGPWRLCPAAHPGEFEVRDAASSGGYAPIAKIKGDKRSTLSQAASNAHLISAAPDLLASCIELLSCIQPARDWDEAKRARAAIKKAEGRA